MIDNINLTSIEPSKPGKTGFSHTSRGDTVRESAANKEDISTAEDSFSESMLKASNDVSPDNEITDKESGGNGLPILDASIENVAEDDRLFILATLDLSDMDVSQIKRLATEGVNSLLIKSDMKINSDEKQFSSSISQLLQLEAKSQGKNVLSNSSNIKPVDNAINRQTEVPPLKLDNIEIAVQKDQLSVQLSVMSEQQSTTTQQSTAIRDIQTSLLLQSASSSVESSNGVLSTSLNPASTTMAPLGMQVTTQATTPAVTQVVIQTEITEPFGRPAWSQGMAKQILWMVNQNISSAEIKLNPANLGAIEVLIDISDDQVNVASISRHAAVREAMEIALPKLREMFDSNGLSLADTDISQQSFAQQREQNTANEDGVFNNNAMQSDFLNADNEAVRLTQISNSMVDYYI